jgi:hypothetical protein
MAEQSVVSQGKVAAEYGRAKCRAGVARYSFGKAMSSTAAVKHGRAMSWQGSAMCCRARCGLCGATYSHVVVMHSRAWCGDGTAG